MQIDSFDAVYDAAVGSSRRARCSLEVESMETAECVYLRVWDSFFFK